MSAAKTSINLNKSAELVVNRNLYLGNKSARISQIIDRYGMLLRNHRNEQLLKIAQNPVVQYCVAEWGEVYPVPPTPLVDLVRIVADEMAGYDGAPNPEELSQAIEATENLTLLDQLVIVEELEARLGAPSLDEEVPPAAASE